MYAEVRVFEDDGREFTNKPYRIPTIDAMIVNELDKNYVVVRYMFQFSMTKPECINPKMIDIVEREHAAYLKGVEEGIRRKED